MHTDHGGRNRPWHDALTVTADKLTVTVELDRDSVTPLIKFLHSYIIW